AALCVVNTRKKAREMFQCLKESRAEPVFHLSTLMCPKHRLWVIDRVRKLLYDGKPCYLVSTQLIEAGVDLDFPCVLREMAPLESIVQAAGRCNREGKLNQPDGKPGGEVIVFRLTDKARPPDLWYGCGIDTLEQNFLAMDRRPDIAQPEQLAEYFRRLYHSGELDAHGIQDARKRLDFPLVAEKYRLIKDDNMTSVVIASWEQTREEVEDLQKQLGNHPIRKVFRKLGPHQVNIYNRQFDVLKEARAIEYIAGINIYRGRYDQTLGIDPEGAVGNYFLL
ncbi:MAG: CRISPR-associated helicase/endonuclease Cas3, partial [Planctomycetota bacterium]|nr:CRISPR-associated helicase/endonuclease Cas3 [Planctomycetota bacterium]